MNYLFNRLGRTTALLVASGLVAYAAGEGSITVNVTDPSGKPLAGATVTVSSLTQIGGSRSLLTDANGRARFVRLSPGSFTVTLAATGFQGQSLKNVDVQVDQTATVNAKLAPVGAVTVEVVSTVAPVDVTTVTTGAHLTQDDLQTLPLGRGQLAALTLVPGVISVGGDPAIAAGLNRNQQGAQGSRNNSYMLDGIDVTNPQTGTLRTSIASELIQDMDIKTGGITAEYSARAGLFTNAVTINGSNEFSGGVSTFQQFGSLQANVGRDKPQIGERRVADYTTWFSGPILKDTLWFVFSAQSIKDTSEGTRLASAGGGTYTTVNNDAKQYFGKLTWQIAPEHQLQFIGSNNPNSFDNGTPSLVANRYALFTRDNKRTSLNYAWMRANTILEFKIARQEEKADSGALTSGNGPQTTVRSSSSLTPLASLLGDNSADTKTTYRKDQARLDFTYLFDMMGSHTFKAGISQGTDQFTQTIGVNGGYALENFDAIYDYGTIAGSPGVSGAVRGARTKTLAVINNNAAYASVKTFLDTDVNGTVSLAEINAYQFAELDPAHPGTYYGYRLIQTAKSSSTPKSKFNGLYVQDQWQMGRVNLTLGIRGDSYKFFADTGEQIWKSNLSDNIAPRLGISWDINGDGRSKLWAFAGRYIDPIKLDMVSFGGSLISSVRNEDIRINGTWVTENVRGGLAVRDALLLDNLKNPKTDELRIGASHDFGGYVLDVVGTYRRDFDIVEDWDPATYADADALEGEARAVHGIGGTVGVYTGATSVNAATWGAASLGTNGRTIIDYWRSLVLPTSFWAGGGRDGAGNLAQYTAGNVNFFLGTLPGGYRIYRTADFTFTRKQKDNWGGFVSASLVNATGNSLSSGNADFQGDLGQFDPRLPYTNGSLEGSVNWMAKGSIYYKWENGVTVSVTYNTNSGYHYSDAFASSGRALQAAPALTAATYQKFYEQQLGRNMTPVQRQMDMRVQYAHSFAKKFKGEVYMDVFNVFNRQLPTDIAEGTNVRTGYGVGQAYAYQAPLSIRLGARLKF